MVLETINDALVECVKAAGGSKAVGPLLWPEKAVNDAQRLLLACLNTERNEKLAPDQCELIFKLAKDHGSHIGIEYLCKKLSYTKPSPIEPADANAQLMRDFIAAQDRASKIAEQLMANRSNA